MRSWNEDRADRGRVVDGRGRWGNPRPDVPPRRGSVSPQAEQGSPQGVPSLTERIHRYLRNLGAWKPVSSISVTEMAVEFDASHTEVLLALSALEAQGRIVTATTVRVVEVH